MGDKAQRQRYVPGDRLPALLLDATLSAQLLLTVWAEEKPREAGGGTSDVLPDTNTDHTKSAFPAFAGAPQPLVPGPWPSSEVAEWKIRFIGCLMPSPLRAQGIASLQPSSSLLSHPHTGLLAGTFAVRFCAASSSKLHIPTQHSKKNTAASLLLPSTGESTPRPPTTGAEEPPARALLAKQYEALAHDASEAHDTSSATVRRSP
ncbi:hypothetical protein GQ607_013845 [Colletotrichum asianum]|uniref:Uncharacterized protein n=1 Tax=Colletotrichum asianum TaxID=702518 RepID=A0A8H3VYH0_9PEZI|nr:hypothetical protein GQ607_013845 [Colletotrichum asianum]